MVSSMRLIESMTLPSSPMRMMLECLPMISTATVSSIRSPISLRVSKIRCRMRSSPICSKRSSLALPRYLRISIQNIGGAFGFSKDAPVRCSRGLSAPAERYSLTLRAPSAVGCGRRRMKIISSREIWCILSMRAPISTPSSSWRIWRSRVPSNAMEILLSKGAGEKNFVLAQT